MTNKVIWCGCVFPDSCSSCGDAWINEWQSWCSSKCFNIITGFWLDKGSTINLKFYAIGVLITILSKVDMKSSKGFQSWPQVFWRFSEDFQSWYKVVQRFPQDFCSWSEDFLMLPMLNKSSEDFWSWPEDLQRFPKFTQSSLKTNWGVIKLTVANGHDS